MSVSCDPPQGFGGAPGSEFPFTSSTIIANDGVKTLWGTGGDASIVYDGSNFIFNSREVGSGDFIFSGGNLVIGTIVATAGIIRLANNTDISWRTAANNTNLAIGFNASDNFIIKIDATTEYSFSSTQADFNGNEIINVGKLGVGTPNPDGKAHIFSGSAGSVTADSNADEFVIENSAAGGMSILVPDAAVGNIFFGNPTGTAANGIVRWDKANDLLTLGTNIVAGQIVFSTGSFVEAVRITSTGILSTGAEAAPDASPGGLTLQQNAEDGNIITLKSTDVAHGMTSLAETDTFAQFIKSSAAGGGLRINTFTQDADAFILRASATTEITTDTSSSKATIELISTLKSGTTVAALGSTGNLLAITNFTTTRFLVKGNGDIHATNTTIQALDDKDDLLLARDLQMATTTGKGYKHLVSEEGMAALKRVGAISSKGHFQIMQGVNAVILGAISQLNNKIGFIADKMGVDAKELLLEAGNYDNSLT